MCGIVGYIGEKNVVDILLQGLYKLEYRGYDSAGIAVIDKDSNELKIIKKVGKIRNLESSMKEDGFFNINTEIGIAHTRWATHGEVNEVNAHPHYDEDKTLAIVHNGIIENYNVIKKWLEEKGVKFKTETDTEVLLYLIKYYYKDDLKQAVLSALKHVIGAYGIVVISKKEPGKMIGARNGSPLVFGIGKDDFVLASDVSAIKPVTDNVIYLEDGHIIEVTKENYKILTLEEREVNAKVHTIDWELESWEKGNFPTYMEKEIHEQPNTIINTTRGRWFFEKGELKLGGIEPVRDLLKKTKKITILGCGTSWHAALIGKYWFEYYADISTEVDYAAEFRYRNPIILEDQIVIAISQSGETADTIGAIREAKIKGATVLGITNVVGSTIARETDAGIYLHAGPEIGVASTKAFIGQLTVLLMMAIYMGRMRRLSIEDTLRVSEEFKKIPDKIEKILKQKDYIREIAGKIIKYNNALYLGRGVNYPVALEGALKFKEISYIHAEGYPAAEMKHGPIALIDENMPTIVIATKDFLYDKIISNIKEVKARKGQVIAIATEDDEAIKSHADYVIYIPDTIDMLTPFLSVIPLQLLAYYAATLKGYDVDKPRNLAKSVTVE